MYALPYLSGISIKTVNLYLVTLLEHPYIVALSSLSIILFTAIYFIVWSKQIEEDSYALLHSCGIKKPLEYSIIN